ncbi:hypothetical protein CesoFtcFv8_022644 [Champsocephalus esox]|uniref:Uncharacterized protein n=1 Tax=Champsocephalus esox TaxID=159716 RepID=A0AAN8B7V4_9TELE|nr:hypothetical protein CesoFtcFv8_022644 [Champsocephalus esox]
MGRGIEFYTRLLVIINFHDNPFIGFPDCTEPIHALHTLLWPCGPSVPPMWTGLKTGLLSALEETLCSCRVSFSLTLRR